MCYLHSGLTESKPLAELLPHECVRVVGLVEQALQLAELLQGEVGAAAARLAVAVAVAVAAAAAAAAAAVAAVLVVACR